MRTSIAICLVMLSLFSLSCRQRINATLPKSKSVAIDLAIIWEKHPSSIPLYLDYYFYEGSKGIKGDLFEKWIKFLGQNCTGKIGAYSVEQIIHMMGSPNFQDPFESPEANRTLGYAVITTEGKKVTIFYFNKDDRLQSVAIGSDPFSIQLCKNKANKQDVNDPWLFEIAAMLECRPDTLLAYMDYLCYEATKNEKGTRFLTWAKSIESGQHSKHEFYCASRIMELIGNPDSWGYADNEKQEQWWQYLAYEEGLKNEVIFYFDDSKYALFKALKIQSLSEIDCTTTSDNCDQHNKTPQTESEGANSIKNEPSQSGNEIAPKEPEK